MLHIIHYFKNYECENQVIKSIRVKYLLQDMFELYRRGKDDSIRRLDATSYS